MQIAIATSSENKANLLLLKTVKFEPCFKRFGKRSYFQAARDEMASSSEKELKKDILDDDQDVGRAPEKTYINGKILN